MKRAILTITILFLLVLFFFKVYIPDVNNKEINGLKMQAQYLITKVEMYKKQHHKLPAYQKDMKLNLPDEYPVFYSRTHDSTIYCVGFEIAPFESMVYYSDTKVWLTQH